MNRIKRSDMPKQKDIRIYWANTSIWRFKGFDSSYEFLEGDYCFACGFTNGESKTERAHIIPLSLGGSNEYRNLHLLCGRCHIDSEHCGNPKYDPFQTTYWEWFFNRTVEDRMVSSALCLGFNYSDFQKGEEHFFNRAKMVFANRPDIISRLGLDRNGAMV